MPAAVVGVSGVTRSGKGTLVKGLLRRFLGSRSKICKEGTQCRRWSSTVGNLPTIVSVIHQDDFFLADKVNTELDANFDSPEALDHNALLTVVQQERDDSEVSLVLLEGFLAFHDARVFSLIDVPLWIQVPRQIALERRMRTKKVVQTYFDNCIWPNHEQYEALVLSRVGNDRHMGLLDGTEPMNIILLKAMEQLRILGGNVFTKLSAQRAAADESAPGGFWKPDYSFRFELRRAACGSAQRDITSDSERSKKLPRLAAWPPAFLLECESTPLPVIIIECGG